MRRVRWSHAFSTVDVHVAGQPLRLITFGVPRLQGATLRERIAELRGRHDAIRFWLLAEPRGRAGMGGAILVPPGNPRADYGVIFLTSSGYPPISGHGVIALATALIGTGAVPPEGTETRTTFETLAGTVQARATIDQGRVRTVRFRNVPAFRMVHDLEVEAGDRTLRVDIAYGGAWYAVVRAADAGVRLHPADAPTLSRLGVAIMRAAANALDIVHPENPDLAGIHGTVFIGPPRSEDATSRTIAVYGDGVIDRSPSGTGMSATMACLAANGRLGVGDTFVCESIIDTTLSGRLVEGTTVGEYPAIVTELAGRGSVTGLHHFIVDPSDALTSGFAMS